MLTLRPPDTIWQEHRPIVNGTFHGRWHFSFDNYRDPEQVRFGPLRVFNDDTMSPGAVWPLHPHHEIEVVTYVAGGSFLHEDEHGRGRVLHEGSVQHTTVGRGMMHSEINARDDAPMRFIQMWILPRERGLDPYWDVKEVDPLQRRNRWLPLVSNEDAGALRLAQDDVRVLSLQLRDGARVTHAFAEGRGGYLYVLGGDGITANGHAMPALAAAMIRDEKVLEVSTPGQAELLLVEVRPEPG